MQNSQSTSIKPGLQKRLLLAFTVITVFFIFLFLIMLPLRFYERDVDEARFKATQISELLNIGLISVMVSSSDSKLISELIKQYQSNGGFQFRLIRSRFVKKQNSASQGIHEKDPLIQKVIEAGKGHQDWVTSTKLRYTHPFVADERCGKCHTGTNGEKIKTGTIVGASEIVFELKAKKYKSIRFIAEVMFMLISCLITLALALFYIVKKGLLDRLINNS